MHSLNDPPPTASPTQTAVIVPVLAAESVVGKHRRHLDRSASWGVPPHVTVLYPFLPPDAVGEAALTALSAAVASVDAFDCAFARTGWFGDDVLWLAPEPSEPLRRLTFAVWDAFPGCPPYGGAFDGVQPHLTVAERVLGGPGALEAAQEAVRGALPFVDRVDHALLIAGSQRPRSWRTLRRLPLGGLEGGPSTAA